MPNILQEVVKSFLKQPDYTVTDKDTSIVDPENTLIDMSDELPTTGSFFDDSNNGVFGYSDVSDILFKQKEKIMKYRQLAMSPDVTDALDEIVNEVIFSYDDKMPLKIDIDIENTKVVNKITEKFEKICKKMNVKRNIYQIVKQSYTDGQLIFHLAYEENKVKNGIKSIKMIDPCLFYFDYKDNTYKYMSDKKDTFGHMNVGVQNYNIEEIVKEDFGLYDGKINLGYLEYALKPANMLKTLEDLLIPMRFSRSISRRVFNVDVGDLPGKRAAEVMQEMQSKFKYKKFYNAETGEVSNQQHITSMVEDYWFSNRSGGKGTQVDVLDESGNLGELDDILYFNRKLYKAMKIPSSRIDPDGENYFDYDSTRVTKDDMKFFMFISRIRQIYSNSFKEILKREVVATGVMTESEWEEYEDEIEISFVNENNFIEKLKLDNFMKKIDIYATAQEYQGKLFSVEKILKDVFKMSDEEIKEEFEKIQKEEKDPLFAKFYQTEDAEGKW